MEKEVFKVEPIVIYPRCIQETGKQFNCHLCRSKDECIISQPRCMCIKPYKGHPNGCPNFGKLPTCPPNNPCMYDELFDCTDVYAIVTKYNLSEHYETMRQNNPGLAEGQVQNKMYWQPTDKKNNDIALADFYRENPQLRDHISTRFLECMGVQVVDTMKKVGLEIKFPVKEHAYRVAFAARVYEDVLEEYGFEVVEEKDKHKKGMLTLAKKKELV